MPRDSKVSHERLVLAAKEEFLTKGFKNASMREIGRKAKMTQAAIYRHFINKEDMFNKLVEPAIKRMDELARNHILDSYKGINEKDETELFKTNNVTLVKEVIYKYHDEFRMILCSSEGTKYENFIHDLVTSETDEMMKAINYLREKGYKIRDISKDDLHVILSSYDTAIFEPIIHDFPLDKALETLEVVEEFFMPSWKKFLGF